MLARLTRASGYVEEAFYGTDSPPAALDDASPVEPALSMPAMTTTVELPTSGETDDSIGCTVDTLRVRATCAASA
jgi:hypothetical protein